MERFKAVMKFNSHYGTIKHQARRTRYEAEIDLENIARDFGAEIVRRFPVDKVYPQSIAMHVRVPDETEGVGYVQRA